MITGDQTQPKRGAMRSVFQAEQLPANYSIV